MENIRQAIAGVIMVSMLCFFFYGVVRFPDSPIHPCEEHQYCGKQGQPHTYNDFKAFTFWQTTCLYTWPVGLLAVFLLNRKRDA